MDHRECRKRIGHLEDELDYNFGRKEELKEEVKTMQDKYDNVYEVYMKNTKAAMDKNVENAELRAIIEQKEKENIELQLKNKKLEEKVDSLGKEISDLKITCSDLPSLRDMESENRYLKDVVKSKENDDDKLFNELKESNKNLNLQVENLLKCDECYNSFSDKALIFNHIKSIHSERKLDFKCDICDDCFADQRNMKEHMDKKHQNKVLKDNLRGKINELNIQIRNQKIRMYSGILKLKQKEIKEKGACACKVRFCLINHAKFRWTASKSDLLLDELNMSNEKSSREQCHNCGETFGEKEALRVHMETNHHTSVLYKCHQCDETYTNQGELRTHTKCTHRYHDVVEPFPCQACDKTFSHDLDLKNHMEEHHEKSVLEKTFFNPSASL